MLWSLYAWPITLYLIPAYAASVQQRGLLPLADLSVSLPGVVALHLHTWDRRTLNPVLWKAYAFALVAWELIYALVLVPKMTGRPLFEPGSTLLGFVVFAPMYVAIFRYAFRRWDGRESP